MNRLAYPIATLLLTIVLSGCATMSQKDCENADWQSIGYSDGSRGVYVSQLEKHRDSCGKYNIVPDDAAYRHGWAQGIRRYCSAGTGFQTGSRGAAHITFCPPDVANDYLSGWEQGVRRYCQPDHALSLGLGGYGYNGVCPPDMADAFNDLYRLGRDVRSARAEHAGLERQLDGVRQALAAEKNPARHRDLLHELARIRHDENRSDARRIALEACMSDDWYDAGYSDGEDGNPERSQTIALTCRSYGLLADRRGYREGWRDGNRDYCTFETGFDVGQANLEYLGVCSGRWHADFWRGYERGRDLYRQARYEVHPKPQRRPSARARPARAKPLPHVKKAPPVVVVKPQPKGAHRNTQQHGKSPKGKETAKGKGMNATHGNGKAKPAPQQKQPERMRERRPGMGEMQPRMDNDMGTMQ